MGNNLKLQYAIRAAIAAATATATPLAMSATAPAGAATESLEEVIVTGSRLAQSPNDVSISPVTSITAVDIQQTGLVRTEDLLNNLPQVVAENSSGQSISSVGTATVSLRGLGSFRTLTLINGRRMNPAAGLTTATSQSDINQIPAALIERADVLTGGASSVYGADAVAGVVNFVLNTHFEGVKIDANYGVGIHRNDNKTLLGYLAARNNPPPPSTVYAGNNRDLSIVAGANFADGKGNATVYATYLNSSPAVGNQYDFAGCTLNTPGKTPFTGKHLACGGSSSSATGRFIDFGVTASSPFATLSDSTVNPSGGLRPYVSARDSYNYGGLSYLQRQAERYTMGGFLNLDVGDHANFYSETMFSRNTSTAQYGPSGLFAFGTPQIHCSNPLLNASELATWCSPANITANQALFGTAGDVITLYAARRSVESGPRLDNYALDSIREVLGVKGKFNSAWTYDAYAQIGISTNQDTEGGFLGKQQVNNALNAVPNPASAANPLVGVVKGVPVGAPVCAITLAGFDAACVPWNLWNPGGVTPAQLKYLTVASSYAVKSTEYIVDGSVSGDLSNYGIKLPTAAGGMLVNFGAEHREEKYDFDPDYIFGNGFASGGGGAINPIHGGFQVSELFTEMRLPLIDEKPGFYELSTEAGYRYSDYNSGFKTDTYKFGVEWAPIKDFRLRAAYNRAVRAPSVGDLFSPAVVGAGGTADPCWGNADAMGKVNGHTAQFCANTGVTAAEFGHILANPAAQINTVTGGNINLKPEVADTFTFGFVAQPEFVPGLVVSVDYFDIKIKKTIQALTSNTIINNCGLTGDPVLCGLIHRGANTGSLWFNDTNFVNATEVNVGSLTTKGIDLASHYSVAIGSAGKLAFNLSGTMTKDYLTQPLNKGSAFDCVGYFGTTCGAPLPKWRHVLSTDWATPWAGLDLTLRWRYIGKSASDRTSSDPQLSQAFLPSTAYIGGFSYFDLSASVPLAKTGIDLRFGINNIADKSPPIVANGNFSDCPNSSCNDNTWVGTYDTLGRYVYAHASIKF